MVSLYLAAWWVKFVMASLVPRELLPAPLPFPGEQVSRTSLARSTRRRLERRMRWQAWANDAVTSLNDVGGFGSYDAVSGGSGAQRQCLSVLCEAFRRLPPPPADLDAAGALRALCGSAPGYVVEELPRVQYRRELVSLPPVGMQFSSLETLLDGDDLNF